MIVLKHVLKFEAMALERKQKNDNLKEIIGNRGADRFTKVKLIEEPKPDRYPYRLSFIMITEEQGRMVHELFDHYSTYTKLVKRSTPGVAYYGLWPDSVTKLDDIAGNAHLYCDFSRDAVACKGFMMARVEDNGSDIAYVMFHPTFREGTMDNCLLDLEHYLARHGLLPVVPTKNTLDVFSRILHESMVTSGKYIDGIEGKRVGFSLGVNGKVYVLEVPEGRPDGDVVAKDIRNYPLEDYTRLRSLVVEYIYNNHKTLNIDIADGFNLEREVYVNNNFKQENKRQDKGLKR